MLIVWMIMMMMALIINVMDGDAIFYDYRVAAEAPSRPHAVIATTRPNVIIGPDADRAAILRDFTRACAPLRKKAALAGWATGRALVGRPARPTAGRPACQTAARPICTRNICWQIAPPLPRIPWWPK